MKHAIQRVSGPILLAWLAVSLSATLYAAFTFQKFERATAQSEFEAIAADSESRLRTRFDRVSLTLGGLTGFFVAQQEPTLEEFQAFTQILGSSDALEAIQGLGFIQSVNSTELSEYRTLLRNEHNREIEVYPPVETDEHMIVRYMEPSTTNLRAVGLDIAFEEGRSAAANAARDTGDVQMTPSIRLVQDDAQKPGFVLMKPVYELAVPTGTVEERREAFLGWVAAPLLASKMLGDLSAMQNDYYDMWAYEGRGMSPETLIYSTSGDASPTGAALFTHSATINLYGQDWTLHWASLPIYEKAKDSTAFLIVLLAGVSLSALVWVAFRSQEARGREVERLVDERTAALKSQISLTESMMDDGQFGIVIIDENGKIIMQNETGAHMLDKVAVHFNGDEFTRRLSNFTPRDERGALTYLDPVTGEKNVLAVSRHDWVNSTGAKRSTLIALDVTREETAIAKMQEAEKRLTLALSVSDIGVFEVNLETGRSVVSDSWRKIMNFPEGLEHEDFQRFFETRLHPDDLKTLQHNDQACIRGETERSITDFRVLINGETRWMRSEAFVSKRDEDGKALRLLGTQLDITERKALETAKSDFIATVSHELRTPITSVKGAIQLLSHNISEDAPGATGRLIKIAQSNVERLVLLVNDILDFEQVQSNRMEFREEDVAVNEVLEIVAQDLQPYAQSHDSTLEITPLPCPANVVADRARMVQVLTNFVSNACKFSPDGSPVRLGAELVGDACRFYVIDEGPGIPADFMQDLFQPFSQVDRSDIRETGGTGLGLSISQRFIEHMHGEIGYFRTEDDKTQFWFTLPLADVDGVEVEEEPTPKVVNGPGV